MGQLDQNSRVGRDWLWREHKATVGGSTTSDGASGTTFQRAVSIAYDRFGKIHGTPQMRLNAGTNEDLRIFAVMFISL